MVKEYHVSKKGNDKNTGSIDMPFFTISKASSIAKAGDTIIVHEGVYREWVKPMHSGHSKLNRITFMAAPNEHVIIKGSEQITNWEHFQGTVWKVEINNLFFGDYNPYKESLSGDWFIFPDNYKLHTGEVYLNGKSFFEACSLEDVLNPIKREYGYAPPWSLRSEKIANPERTIYQWFSIVSEETTTIYANFHSFDPNNEVVEINVRKCCFYPEQLGMNYITVRGFEMAQAATPWTPPTADQPGLLGTHWSKGWIIENNIIHDSKCSAISIGKESQTGHNLCTRYHQKPGYQYQMESVFQALKIGWSKENIGSHIIQNNIIYDCGQNAIVGHMGCIFSTIKNNHIYNIANKHEFFGYEIAGIKLHAAIDVLIENNHIHDCTLGVWLDWQAQGARISRNLFYENNRDFMIEVTHGPYIVDNNLFLSEYNFDNVAQGGAYINNLCCGSMRRVKVLDRSTPYHFPHSTEIAGSAVVYSGDDRLYNNIFIGLNDIPENDSYSGTGGYDDCTASYEDYITKITNGGTGDLEKFITIEQPVYINNNVYFNGSHSFYQEQHSIIYNNFNPNVTLTKKLDGIFITLDMPEDITSHKSEVITTTTLGTVRIVDAIYDDANGNFISIDTDFFGLKFDNDSIVGPIQSLKPGKNTFKVW